MDHTEELSNVTAFAVESAGETFNEQIATAIANIDRHARIHVGVHDPSTPAMLSEPIAPQPEQGLYGHGINQSVLKHDASSDFRMLEQIDIGQASNFKINDLRLHANKEERSGSAATVFLKNNRDGHIEDVWVSESPGIGVHQVNGGGDWFERLWIETGDDWGFYFEYPGGDGFDSAPGEIYIENCTIQDNNGGVYSGPNVGRGMIINSEVRNEDTFSRDAVKIDGSLGAWYIEGCEIVAHNGGTAVPLDAWNSHVSDSLIETDGYGVHIMGNQNGVSGGRIDGASRGVWVDQGRNNSVSTAILNGGTGVRDEAIGTTVVGANMWDTVSYGIFGAGSRGSTYVGNTLVDTALDGGANVPIRLNNVSGGVVGLNAIRQETAGPPQGIVLTGSDNCIVTHNRIQGSGFNNSVYIGSNCSDTQLWGIFPDGVNDNGTQTLINGVGAESAEAETPSAEWPTGAVVDFTDSGDGSGTGVYQKMADGTWYAA